MSAPRHAASRSGVPDFTLERYRLGELPARRMAEIENGLRHDAALRARLEALGQADEQARRRYSPDDIAHDVRRRLGAAVDEPPRGRLKAVWLVSAAAVVLLAIAVSPPGRSVWSSGMEPAVSSSDGDRHKGADLSLFVYRNTETGVERLTDHDAARTGDLVRLGYRVANPVYGVIVSIDGRGLVSRHLPPDGARAVRLEPDASVLLDGAFELDDAPEVERFFLVAAPEPFDLEPVLGAVRAAATGAGDPTELQLPEQFTSTAFSLRKDPRP